MTISTTRYIFVREVGSRHGELHRERGGFVKIVARAYLNDEGWLMHSAGGWLAPGRFSMTIAAHDKRHDARVSIPLSRLITQSMRQARALLSERFHAHPPVSFCEPLLSSERDTRQRHSL